MPSLLDVTSLLSPHPNALRRSARYADSWMGNGNSFTEQFKAQREVLVSALEEQGRYPETFPISKHVHLDSGEPGTAWAGLSTPNVYLYPRLKADTAAPFP